MLLDDKLIAAEDKIADLRDLYDEEAAVLSALDDAEVAIISIAGDARAVVSANAPDMARIVSLQSLANQLPIPDVPECLEAVAGSLAALANAPWFDVILWHLNVLDSDPPAAEAEALATLDDLMDVIAQKSTAIDSMPYRFTALANLQETIRIVIGVIGAMTGTIDGIAAMMAPMNDALLEFDPIMAATITAVGEAEAVYSNPMDIMVDARGRATASMNLDGAMSSVRTGLMAAILTLG